MSKITDKLRASIKRLDKIIDDPEGHRLNKILSDTLTDTDTEHLKARIHTLENNLRETSNNLTAMVGLYETQKARADRHERIADEIMNHCCPDGECGECAKVCCPHKDPMHFHHDGCPSCAEDPT